MDDQRLELDEVGVKVNKLTLSQPSSEGSDRSTPVEIASQINPLANCKSKYQRKRSNAPVGNHSWSELFRRNSN